MKNPQGLLFLFLLTVYNFSLSAQDCQKLIWADEFNDSDLNLAYWNYDIGNGCPDLCGWGNNEEQYYTDSKQNVRIENGKLIISALEDTIGGMKFSSGKITTKNKVDFRYGRIEASVKLPESQGLWPALWMLSTDDIYGEWPKSGEIDIFELLGHEPNKILGTIHTGLPWQFIKGEYVLGGNQTFKDDFHTVAFEWGPDTVTWFVDDIPYHQVTSDSLLPWQPFQEDFHLILNVAVGGNLPGFTDSSTILPQTMEVDYVRVYSYIKDLRIRGEQPVIGEQGLKYKTFFIEGASYDWNVPEGTTIIEGQGSNEITVDWGCSPGNVTLEIQTDCDSSVMEFEVIEFAKTKISGSQIIERKKSNLVYSVPEMDNATYEWTVPEDAIIVNGQGTSEITLDWGCSPGMVAVEINSPCELISTEISIELRNYIVSGSAFVPENSPGQIYKIDPINNVTYHWTVPDGAVITSGNGTNQISVDFGNESGRIEVEIMGECGSNKFGIDVLISILSIYCDFDGTDLDFATFGGASFEKIPNLLKSGIDTSDHIGKSRKDPGAVDWGGIFADLGGELNFTDNPYINMKVYAQKSGIVKFKIEDLSGGTTPVEIDLELTKPNEWVNLVYDFSGQPDKTYDRIALFFDFGDVDTSDWFFDDIIGSSGPMVVSTRKITTTDFNAFPNPTLGKLTIDLSAIASFYDTSHIKLVNHLGQIVFEQKIQSINNQISLELPSLTPGAYFLTIEQNDLTYLKKIVVN